MGRVKHTSRSVDQRVPIGERVTDPRPSDILTDIMRREEERILASLPGERRWGLLELVRAIDHYFVHIFGLDERGREEEIQSERWDLFRYGQSKAISLFTDQSSISPGPSLTRSTQTHQQWADAVIQACGRLGICQMLLNLHSYGLVELSMPYPRAVHATVNLGEVGVEAVEANEFRIFGDLAAEMDQQMREHSKAIAPTIKALMSPLVSPWREHYIQYDTVPEIDHFFRNQGLLWARARYEPGQDAFAPYATFGDLPFALYREAVVEVIAWVLKHLTYTNLLLSKHPQLDIRNILTVTTGEPQLLGYLSAALAITETEAQQVLDTLKSTPDSVQAQTSEPAVDIAPFLKINSSTVVFSIAGTLSSPFDFMLAELYRRYRRDWDHAVNEREDSFRKELYDLFPTERFAKTPKQLVLKREGAFATDIDAAVFDRATGTLGIFQLKWQDPFGTSMRKRNSKMMNFLSETNRWISTVSTILLEHPHALDRRLGEGTVRTHDVESIHLFVIGRHFSHFSGGASRDSRAAWGTWPQVLRLFKESAVGPDPIMWLHKTLQEQSPTLKTPVTLETYEMRIGEYRIKYDPVSAHQDSPQDRNHTSTS